MMYHVFTTKGCGYCQALKKALDQEEAEYTEIIDAGRKFSRHPVMTDEKGVIIFSGLPKYELLKRKLAQDKNK